MTGGEETQPGLNPFAAADEQIAAEALARGFATSEQLAACRQAQTRLAATGEISSLAEVMVSEGAVTASQAEQLKQATGAAPRRIAGYEIVRTLGRGAMGMVFLARQVAMDRQVALKVVAPELVATPGWLARFQREARSVARLNHPHIVQAYDAGEDNGRHYIAMEYVAGEDLASRLQREKVLGEALVKQVARQMAQALNHAHEHQVIHRDIKPANILISDKGQAKLADYGLAKQQGGEQSQLTLTGVAVGTPYYISPEQVETPKAIDIRADIYCLGATLYHLLAGRPPFPGQSPTSVVMKVLNEDPEPLDKVNPHLDARFCRVVMKMMARAPGQRYQTPAELLAALEALDRPAPAAAPAAAGAKAEAPAKAPPIAVIRAAGPTPAAGGRGPVIGLVAGLAAVAVALYFFWSLLSSNDSGPGKPEPPPSPTPVAVVTPPRPATVPPVVVPPVSPEPPPPVSPEPPEPPKTPDPDEPPGLPAHLLWPGPEGQSVMVHYDRNADPERFARDWRELALPGGGSGGGRRPGQKRPRRPAAGDRQGGKIYVHRRLRFSDIRAAHFMLAGEGNSDVMVFFENLFERGLPERGRDPARRLILSGRTDPPGAFFLKSGQRPPQGRIPLPTRLRPAGDRPADLDFRLEFIEGTMVLSVGPWGGERHWDEEDLRTARAAPLNLRLPADLDLREVLVEVFR